MRLLITGAAGFIGSSAAGRFLAGGHQVVGLDNLSRPGSGLNLDFLRRKDGNFRFRHADIRNRRDLERVFLAEGPFDLILHEAAQVAVTFSVADPITDFDINALGTFNLLEVTRQASPDAMFLFASTNKVYGALPHLTVSEKETRYQYSGASAGINESEPLDFHSPYGCSKGSADQYVRDYARIFGMKTVVIRQSCIYGTRQFGVEDQGWVAWFVIAATLGKNVVVYGDGKQVRDILWIDDLLDLYCYIVDNISISTGKIYNAGGGSGFTLSILELLSLLQNRHSKRMNITFADWRPGDQKVFIADCGAALRDLKWAPKISPVEGVQRLVEWAGTEADLLRTVLG